MKDARRNSNREGYSSVNQKDNEDANKLPRDNGVFFEGRSSINHNRGNSLLVSILYLCVNESGAHVANLLLWHEAIAKKLSNASCGRLSV